MAVVGLMPDHRIDDDSSASLYLSHLVEFVFAMRDKLLAINDNSYNNFMLRVGKFIIILVIYRNRLIIFLLNKCFYEFSFYFQLYKWYTFILNILERLFGEFNISLKHSWEYYNYFWADFRQIYGCFNIEI